jgi:hypothetical protein
MQYLWIRTPPSEPEQKREEEKEEEKEPDKCPICLHDVQKVNVSITACGHMFCTSCLLSSLTKDNRCPLCRAELEPTRLKIDPITVSAATELIRREERVMKLIRRIEMIQSFDGHNGKSSMIFSLCREFAFATAHAIARWQNTTGAYDESWEIFDSDASDDDSDDE